MKIKHVAPILMAIILTACASSSDRKAALNKDDADDGFYVTGSMLPHKVTDDPSNDQSSNGQDQVNSLRQTLTEQPSLRH